MNSKKLLLFVWLCLLCLPSWALFSDGLTAVETAERLKACKTLKEQNLLEQLTMQDLLTCNELLSADLLANPPRKNEKLSPSVKIEKNANGYRAGDEYARQSAYAQDPWEKYGKKRTSARTDKSAAPSESEFWQRAGEIIGGILFVGIILILFWLVIYKFIPKFIYTIRKAWLHAAADVKKK